MSEYGLLINYDYCTGCHSCEVACMKVHDFSDDDCGIKLFCDGPRQNTEGAWEYTYLPLPTKMCDLCEERVGEGRLPTCVHHCQSGIIFYDTLEELTKLQVEKPRTAVFTPR